METFKKMTSDIAAGVSKSDSPVDKFITGMPAATRALALLYTFIIVEGLAQLSLGFREVSNLISSKLAPISLTISLHTSLPPISLLLDSASIPAETKLNKLSYVACIYVP